MSPLKLKFKSFEFIIGLGNLYFELMVLFAAIEISGPPGYFKPIFLATLSNTSPAESSSDLPIISYELCLSILEISVCPPDTRREIKGGSRVFSEIIAEKICASR